MADGTIVTFYSYKGGVGRSFALANVAVALASWGHRVLCVDWDLEAPGLSHYFGVQEPRRGLVELILGVRAATSPPPTEVDDALRVALAPGKDRPSRRREADRPPSPEVANWRNYLTRVSPAQGVEVDLIAAGRQDDGYIARVQDLQWVDLYENGGLAAALEAWRGEWKAAYDFVLIDSRTGVTDIGAICTAHLPDILAVFFTANNQSVDGCVSVVDRAIAARKTIAFDRTALHVLPVPSRFDAREEFKRAEEWRSIFEGRVGRFFGSWAEVGVDPGDLIDLVCVPYVAYWSFGEGLPMLEEAKRSPGSIRLPLETIAALLSHRMGNTCQLIEGTEGYIRSAARSGHRPGGFAYDLFLSSTPDLEAKAHEVAQALEAMEFRVFIDEPPRPGDAPEAEAEPGRALSLAQHGVFLIGRDDSPRMDAQLRQFARQLLDDQAARTVLPIAFEAGRSRAIPSLIRKSLVTVEATAAPLALAELIAHELGPAPAPVQPDPAPNPEVRMALARLDHANPLTRKAAVATLGRVGGPREFDRVLGKLGDPDERVDFEAKAAALGIYGRSKWPPGDARHHLKPLLESREAGIRVTGVELLVSLAGPHAVPPLLALVSDASPEVKVKAAEALGALRDPETVFALVDVASDPSPEVRAAAVTALGRIGHPASFDWLVVCLHDEDHAVQLAAVGALVETGDPRLVDTFLDLLDSRPERADSLIARAAGDPRGKPVLDALMELAGDRSASGLVFSVLARLDPTLAGPRLAGLLSAGEVGTRARAAEALGQVGGDRAVADLIGAIGDGEPVVRGAGAWALGMIGGHRAVEALLSMFGDPDLAVREQAGRALAEAADDRVVEPLLEAFAHHDPEVRKVVAKALGKVNGPGVVTRLIDGLEDQSPLVREQSASALGGLRDPGAIDALGARRGDGFEEVRRAAVIALGQIGGPLALAHVSSQLEDQGPSVREEAVRILGFHGGPEMLPALQEKLDDPSAPVRMASVEAIARSLKLDRIDRALLSRDLDGVGPFVDPHVPIPEFQLEAASTRLGIPIAKVRARFDALRGRLGGKLMFSEADPGGSMSVDGAAPGASDRDLKTPPGNT